MWRQGDELRSGGGGDVDSLSSQMSGLNVGKEATWIEAVDAISGRKCVLFFLHRPFIPRLSLRVASCTMQSVN